MQIAAIIDTTRGLRRTIEKMRDFINKQGKYADRYAEIHHIMAGAKVFTVGRGGDIIIRCSDRDDRKRLLSLLAGRS